MLRISQLETDGIVTLHLEGKLLAPWVAEVEALLPRGGSDRSRVDLADVSFVDRAGAELLLDLRRRGVLLVGCSQFVAELLRAESGRA